MDIDCIEKFKEFLIKEKFKEFFSQSSFDSLFIFENFKGNCLTLGGFFRKSFFFVLAMEAERKLHKKKKVNLWSRGFALAGTL